MLRAIFSTALVLSFGLHLSAQAPFPTASLGSVGIIPERLAATPKLLQEHINEGKIAGASYLILRQGLLVEQRQFGLANLDNRTPMRSDTIFRIYSMTKPITSVAALQLVEQGRLNLNDPITRWLPELEGLKVYRENTASEELTEANPITVRMLLNHTAGFTYDFFEGSPVHELYKQQDLWSSADLDDFIQRVAKLPLLSAPGTAFNYSIGLDVLGALIERVAHEPFPSYLDRHIFQPLGMEDTGFNVPDEKRPRLATIHQLNTSGKLETTTAILGAYAEAGKGIPSGGGGLFSTINDYARFAQMLLNKGTFRGERILGRKTVELALQNSLTTTSTPYNSFSPSDGWGLLGAVRLDVGRGGELGSKGMFYWSGAATTHFFVDPTEGLIGLVFTQHIPFDQHNLFSPFRNTVYQALE